MPKHFKVAVILLLVFLSVIVQLTVWASAFRVTGNLEWYKIQLLAFVFDGFAILAVLRFLRRKPAFSAAVLFVLATDVSLLFLALLARSAPYRFGPWFDQ